MIRAYPANSKRFGAGHFPLPGASGACVGVVRDAGGAGHQQIQCGARGSFVAPPGRYLILVPGQVTDDASVMAGGLGIASNLELLRRVRARAPNACIVYKPHPDVLSGHRAGAVRRADAERYADLVVTDVAMPALLDHVQEVHTLTSLTGFEALFAATARGHLWPTFLRKDGDWTEDVAPVPRRARKLSLVELVAGALILYPLYIDPVTLLPCSVEFLLERLGEAKQRQDWLRLWLRQSLGNLRRIRRQGTLDWC